MNNKLKDFNKVLYGEKFAKKLDEFKDDKSTTLEVHTKWKYMYRYTSYNVMPKYVIEQELPGAGKLTPEHLKGILQTSCGVLSNMGPQIQWVQSYVTADKIYCDYNAPNEKMVREHAKQGGFPANSVYDFKQLSYVRYPSIEL